MPSKQTGKQRAAPIPLDYFKTRDPLSKAKVNLTLLALVAAVVWWGIGLRPTRSHPLAESEWSRMRYSHGPVAEVHATWDSRCEACHLDFKPINADSWTAKVGVSPKISEKNCQNCHQVKDHNDCQKSKEVVSCAGCHFEHRGRDASLVKLADASCTSCHEKLASHVAGPDDKVASDKEKSECRAHGYASISAFPSGHEEFALLRGEGKPSVSRSLKFSHAVHLAPGFNPVENGKPLMMLGQLDKIARQRYGPDGADTDAVQLNCASCHRLENGSLPPSAPTAVLSSLLPGTGAYMKPISYQMDCASCHALDVNVWPDDKVPRTRVPHLLQPSAVREWLTNASIGISLAKDPKLPEKLATKNRPMPGRSELEQSIRDDVDARIKVAEGQLYAVGEGTCTKCHNYQVGAFAKPEPDRTLPIADLQIQKTLIRTNWFEHAKFDHHSHRAVSCQDCHEGTNEPLKLKPGSIQSSRVLLPNLAKCAACHAATSHDAQGSPRGGAGHSCTECHRYHGGDHKIDAEMPSKTKHLGIDQFLQGLATTPKK